MAKYRASFNWETKPVFPHKGVIDFVDNHVDTTTGTQRIRGILENESGTLDSGLVCAADVPGSGRYQAVLVPDKAIGNDQSQRDVLVVDKDNKVVVRPVVLGALFGGLAIDRFGYQSGGSSRG